MSEDNGFGSEDIQTVRKYALQNAIEYGGEGKTGSVLGRVLAERTDLRPHAKRLLKLIETEVDLANSMANNQDRSAGSGERETPEERGFA
jgi:hypothetical protein